jgi:hypothetical protein
MQNKPVPGEVVSLGAISPGQFDTQREVGDAPAPLPNEADSLRLPRGGWIALRKSGGFRFTSREVVVYRDGRVAADGSAAARRNARHLTEQEMAALQAALAASDLRHLPASTGHQSPDAYAYEIVARIGRKEYSAEVFDGSIPATLAPLLSALQRLLPTQQ